MNIVGVQQLFGIINCMIIAGSLYYFFRRSRPKLDQALQEDRNKKSAQQQLLSHMESQYDNIALALQHQETINKQLLVKLEQWHTSSQKKNNQYNLAQQEIQTRFQERLKIQEHHLRTTILFNQALPQALQEVEALALQKYAQPGQQQEYIKKIITHIEQRIV